MNKFVSIAVATALSGAGLTALAQQSTPKAEPKQQTSATAPPATNDSRVQMAVKAMDANSDGQVSKQEYIAYTEGVYAKLRKGSDSQVSLKDMESGISALLLEPIARVESTRLPVAGAEPKQQTAAAAAQQPTAAAAAPKQQTAAAAAATPKQQTAAAAAATPKAAATAATARASDAAQDLRVQAQLKAMDTNSDGMVSRKEYITYHETAFDGMKKDSSGMLVLKDIG